MSDRYKPLFSLKPFGYSPGVPVLIYAGKLLWDNYSNRPCVQLKLQSLSAKVIRSVSIQIESKDFNGEPIESAVHIYNQLNVARDQFFGDQEVIPLNDTSSISFSAAVIEAVLYDGTTIIPDDNSTINLPDLQSLRTWLEGDVELEKQFQKENGKNHVYAPVIACDIWRCSCGAINNEQERICHKCRIPFETDMNLDLDSLKARRNARVKAETAAKSHREKKVKQLLVMVASLLIAAAIIAAVVYFLIVPSIRYKQASKNFAAGDYQTAYAEYTKNGSFKDSSTKANEAKKEYWASVYNRILTEGYKVDSGDYNYIISKKDASDENTVFGLAYIDDDDIPELLVSPYSESCLIFSIKEGDGYIGGVSLVNTWLSLNTDDNYEIGYYERNGYVYDRHSGADNGYGYERELWVPLDENKEFDYARFNIQTERYTYFGSTSEYSDYTIAWSNDSEEQYDEQSFYDNLHNYINVNTYKNFMLYENTDKNRHKVLKLGRENA